MTNPDRRLIPATCQVHGGCIGFTNLVLTHLPTGEVVFDPHVDQSCVLRLDRASVGMVYDVLGEWLSRP